MSGKPSYGTELRSRDAQARFYVITEISNFLSDMECQQIIAQVSRQVLEPSQVGENPESNNNNIEPTNQETFNEWDYNQDRVISPLEVMHNLIDLSDLYFSEKDVIQIVAALTKLPFVVVSQSEKLQVVQYGPEGHYHCHHDSQDIEDGVPCCYERDKRHCRLCRFITILYFLNDVEEGGETAFPVADNSTFSIEAWAGITKYRCDLSKHCHKANLYIPPKKGTAIMWYNHYVDSTTGWVGGIDPMTYHGGCDVIRGQKWIANNWINIMGESRDRMVTHTNPTKKI
ncbi:hypothetical protein QZH41_013878 [Actinostola sp. cb2023]|nr:hypothetical protein QZH41_013878 [Actinostola sp. cb2023]